MHKHTQRSDLDTQLVQARMYSVKRGIPKLQQRCFDTGTVRGSIPLILLLEGIVVSKNLHSRYMKLIVSTKTYNKFEVRVYAVFQSVSKGEGSSTSLFRVFKSAFLLEDAEWTNQLLFAWYCFPNSKNFETCRKSLDGKYPRMKWAWYDIRAYNSSFKFGGTHIVFPWTSVWCLSYVSTVFLVPRFVFKTAANNNAIVTQE